MFPKIFINFASEVNKKYKTMNQVVVDTIRNYFKTKPVDKVWLFGSFARGEEREDSDVDILIEFTPGTRMGLAFCGMICDLEDAIHRPVDLVRRGCLKPFAQDSVERDKVLVYERTN